MLSKLNWLVQNTSPGSLVLQAWLTKHGVSPQLAQKYVKSGWLQKIRFGVYARPGKPPQWHNAVGCLIEQLELPAHVAGLTSLTYQGKSHYLQLQEKVIWLEIPPKTTLPKWFKAFPEYCAQLSLTQSCDDEPSKNSLATQSECPYWLFVTSNKLLEDDPSDLIKIEVNNTQLKASRPELAAFELLNAVPTKISFEHAAEVFQGLTNLTPRKVQSLLNRSNTVKTNRLFLFLANYYKHPWASRIDESQINLGSGKRQVVTGGMLDHDYQITVPELFLAKDNKF
jgi:Transcriptional regulator, AbiEi antitoxin, Type IV TA system/Transcriptional regulator, AbiEi antitoxin N-terminal domain